MKNTRWKDHERWWAKQVGSHREGPQGAVGPDIRTAYADFEVKSYQRVFWSRIETAVAQIMKAGAPEKLKAAVIFVKGSRDPYVTMRGSEFLKYDWTPKGKSA